MAQPFIINSLNSGELSPYVYGRTDYAKYKSGLALCRNFFPDARGGILNRAGTRYVGNVVDSTTPNRLIPFTFNTLQAYALVFGNQTMRVIKDGAYVLEPTSNVTSITQATPAVVTASSLAFSNGNLANGDTVFLSGIIGMTQLNGRFFIAQSVNLGAGTFALKDLYGANVNSTGYGAYTSGGTLGRVFTLATPYAAADLALVKFAQTADVMTLCHPSYAPQQLTRYQHWVWTMTAAAFGPTVPFPTNLAATASMTGATGYQYVVTALIGSVESRASNIATIVSDPLSTTAGAIITVGWSPVAGATQYYIYRTSEVISEEPQAGSAFGFIGTTFGTGFTDNNIQPNFSIAPPQGNNPFSGQSYFTGVTVTSGGSGYTTPVLIVSDSTGTGATLTANVTAGVITSVTVNTPGSNYSNTPSINIIGGTGSGASAGVITSSGHITSIPIINGGSGYTNPQITINSLYGSGATFSITTTVGVITAIAVLTGGTGYGGNGGDGPDHPVAYITDSGAGSGAILTPILANQLNNPSCTCFYQQRQVFAATENSPDEIDFSKSGDYLNFDYSNPTKDDDAIQITIASTQVNAIKALVPFTSLVVFSSGSAWSVNAGSQGAALTPSSVNANPQAFSGASDLPPIIINYDILYVQAKQAAVRDISYNFYLQIYTGTDISILSNHLFFGHKITEWGYSEEPFKLVWCVRDDGIFLSLTYLKEQDVYAWARHDSFNGRVKSVCVISEGDEDVPYFIVERLVNGQYLQYVERMQSRLLGGDPTIDIPGNLDNAWFVDAGLQTALNTPAATLIPQATSGSGIITSVVVVNGGSGYTSPIINFNDPAGTGATATPTVVAGVITVITVNTSGTGYTNPEIFITDPIGVGAVVQPIVQYPVAMNASASVFTSANVGNAVRINDGFGIVTAQTGTGITVNVTRPLTSIWPALAGAWSCTPFVTSVRGADHLNGQTVAILTDGNVQTSQVVIDGSVTLPYAASLVTLGLPIQAQAESMYIDTGENPTMQTKRVQINCITVRVKDSRGLKVGHSFNASDLYEIKERTTQPLGQPIQLITGDERTVVNPQSNAPEQICIQQDYPLPAQVCAVILELSEGDTPR